MATSAAQKQHCFAFVFPMASGHINPSLPVARSLIQLGHKVHYLCREQMREAIEDTGAQFHSEIDALSELYEGREPDVHGGATQALLRERGIQSENPIHAMTKVRNLELELQIPGLVRWMRCLNPSVVVFCCQMSSNAGQAAKYLGIPRVAFMTTAGPGSVPKSIAEFLAMLGATAESTIEASQSYEPNLEAVRRMNEQYGLHLTPVDNWLPFGKIPILKDCAFTFVTTCEDLQDPVPEELAESYRSDGVRFDFLGPLLDETGAKRAAGHKLKGDEGTHREKFAHGDLTESVRNAKSAGRQVILVSMGTVITGDSPEFGWEGRTVGADGARRGLTGRELCRAVWAGVFDTFGAERAEDGPLIVVALGPQPDALGEVKPPANSVCIPVIPQVDILKVGVDVFLTNGGQNSFTEGLAGSTPLVVCPGLGDQLVNARKAEELGVGVQVARPDPDEGNESEAAAKYRAHVAAALKRVIAEPLFTEAAKQCARRLEAAGGVPRAVELILSTAARGMEGGDKV